MIKANQVSITCFIHYDVDVLEEEINSFFSSRSDETKFVDLRIIKPDPKIESENFFSYVILKNDGKDREIFEE